MAIIWALVSGSTLFLGAYFGIKNKFSHSWIARIMALGSGALLGHISIEMTLMAKKSSGTANTILGLVIGSLGYCTINWYLSKQGAKHRKRCGECVQQPTEGDTSGSGMAIAAGTLADASPKGLIIGINLAQHGHPGTATVLAFLIANFPESLSSSTGMTQAKRSKKYINLLWASVLVVTIISSVSGALLFPILPEIVKGYIEAATAGLLFAMVVETMVPEAFDKSPDFSGILAVLGFAILAFTAAQ